MSYFIGGNTFCNNGCQCLNKLFSFFLSPFALSEASECKLDWIPLEMRQIYSTCPMIEVGLRLRGSGVCMAGKDCLPGTRGTSSSVLGAKDEKHHLFTPQLSLSLGKLLVCKIEFQLYFLGWRWGGRPCTKQNVEKLGEPFLETHDLQTRDNRVFVCLAQRLKWAHVRPTRQKNDPLAEPHMLITWIPVVACFKLVFQKCAASTK